MGAIKEGSEYRKKLAQQRAKYIGMTFNYLTVIKTYMGEYDKKPALFGTFYCKCGTTVEKVFSPVKIGIVKSCGCYQTESLKKRFTTHGMSKNTREYNSWENMKQRCDNPNRKEYKNYGGRGITYCIEWRSFEAFLRDMGNRPLNTSLDRIDNNKGYHKDNCKWSNRTQQNTNNRKKITLAQRMEIFKTQPGTNETAKKYKVGTSYISKIKQGQYLPLNES